MRCTMQDIKNTGRIFSKFEYLTVLREELRTVKTILSPYKSRLPNFSKETQTLLVVDWHLIRYRNTLFYYFPKFFV